MKWTRRHPATTVLYGVGAARAGNDDWVWACGLTNKKRPAKQKKAQREQQTHPGQLKVPSTRRLRIGSGRTVWTRRSESSRMPRINSLVANSSDLRTRMTKAETDIRFAQELDRIRQAAAATVVQRQVIQSVSDLVHSPVAPSEPSILHEEYVAAFTVAGASRSTATSRKQPLVSGRLHSGNTQSRVDQWAFAAFTLDRERKIQIFFFAAAAVVANRPVSSIPMPNWRDRFRDATSWQDKQRSSGRRRDESVANTGGPSTGNRGRFAQEPGRNRRRTHLLEERPQRDRPTSG